MHSRLNRTNLIKHMIQLNIIVYRCLISHTPGLFYELCKLVVDITGAGASIFFMTPTATHDLVQAHEHSTLRSRGLDTQRCGDNQCEKNQPHLPNRPVVPTYPRGFALGRLCRIPRGRATSLRVSHETQKITIVLYSATNSGMPTFHTCESKFSKGMFLNGKSRSSISHIVMANMYMSDLVCGHGAIKGKGVRNSMLCMHVIKEHL